MKKWRFSRDFMYFEEGQKVCELEGGNVSEVNVTPLFREVIDEFVKTGLLYEIEVEPEDQESCECEPENPCSPELKTFKVTPDGRPSIIIQGEHFVYNNGEVKVYRENECVLISSHTALIQVLETE